MSASYYPNSEFFQTNRRGGYAAYDLSQGVTRKYHGLLVAGLANFERLNLVTSLNEFLKTEAGDFNFSAHHYSGDDSSDGTDKRERFGGFLTRSYFQPHATQKFRVGQVEIKKEVIFSETSNKVDVNYTISSPISGSLVLEPLINCRNANDIGLKLDQHQVEISETKDYIEAELKPGLEIKFDLPDQFNRKLIVSHNHHYEVEAGRGYEAREDLIILGEFSYKFAPGHTKINFSIELVGPKFGNSDNYSLISELNDFSERYQPYSEDFSEFLVVNARKFAVNEEKRESIIAGYPWFADWGRDTFISFKGIYLALGRYQAAQRLLLDWSTKFKAGLLPNRADSQDYNSLDAVLWYFVAIWHYWQATKDNGTIREILPELEEAISTLHAGTDYGITSTDKGYLIWTDSNAALTWMDASIDGKPVIDRSGAAVEIQALWYNALQILEKLAQLTDFKLRDKQLLDHFETQLERNFANDFWLVQKGYYADGVDLAGNHRIELRPNQLLLYSLPFRLGSLAHGESALVKINAELHTPGGLRTLSPNHANYIGVYAGDQLTRDRSYHQGIIWPWLAGPYNSALLKLNNYSPETIAKVNSNLSETWRLLSDSELSVFPELFSEQGNELAPAGAPLQAWSVASHLEVLMELSEFKRE